jgi:hypothetical protein
MNKIEFLELLVQSEDSHSPHWWEKMKEYERNIERVKNVKNIVGNPRNLNLYLIQFAPLLKLK